MRLSVTSVIINEYNTDAETAELPKFHGYCMRDGGICEKLKKFLETTDKENNMKKETPKAEVIRRPAIRPEDDGDEKDDRCDDCIAAHPGCDRCCVQCGKKKCEQRMPCGLGYRTSDGEQAEVLPALNEEKYPITITETLSSEERIGVLMNTDIDELTADKQLDILERRIGDNMAGFIIVCTALKKVWEKNCTNLKVFRLLRNTAGTCLTSGNPTHTDR
ncbi:MAG: hypothetical protein GY749_02830 [Desulfobacteraceae bacterium]|nr:hypothetical protein [Desulfobacteraceae bacterium]